MRTIKYKDIDTAIRIYYENVELGSAEIKELFGTTSSSTVTKLKNEARCLMRDEGIKSFANHAVVTEAAYRAWHIDIEALEKRRAKLKKLGLNA